MTRTKMGSGQVFTAAGVVLTMVVTLVTVTISVGRIANTVEHTADEVTELKEGQKMMIDIMADQREMQNELINHNRRIGDLEYRLLEEPR